MKKPTRIGTIILTLGVAFAMLTIMRGAGTETGEGSSTVSPNKPKNYTSVWVPRDLLLEINAPPNVTIKIFDPSGAIIFQANNVTSGSYTISLEKRGKYVVGMYNLSNSTIVGVGLHYTFYNLEKDLIYASIILTTLGTITIIIQHAYSTLKHKKSRPNKQKNQAHHPTPYLLTEDEMERAIRLARESNLANFIT
jgi:hypothetical protein